MSDHNLVPEGPTIATVTSSQVKKATTGKHYVEIMFRPDGADVSIPWMGFLHDVNAQERTGKALATLGWDPYQHDYRIKDINATDLLVGAKANITVEHNEYRGRVSARVGFINPAPLDDDEIDALTHQIKLDNGLVERPAGTPAGGTATAVDDDEIPF